MKPAATSVEPAARDPRGRLSHVFRVGESFTIGDVRIEVVRASGSHVRLVITAPRGMHIDAPGREEAKP